MWSTCVVADARLPMFLDNAIHDLTNVVVYTVLIATMLPWFLLVLPVAGAAFMFLYAVFRVSIRRLQRYQLESMSPLLTHVDASVHGLSSVHAYQRVDHFQRRPVSCILKSLYIYVTPCSRSQLSIDPLSPSSHVFAACQCQCQRKFIYC